MKNHLKFGKIINEESFCSFIKQFSTSEILDHTYKLSKDVYLNNCSLGFLKRHIIEKDLKKGNYIEQDIIIQPWQFADLIYKSVIYSNDYKGVTNVSDNIFLFTLLEINDYIEMLSKELIKNLSSEFEVSLFLYGFGGEQFKYQTQIFFYQNLIRELYIIFSISKKYSSKINSEEIIKKEIGVEWKDLILVLFGIFIDSLFHQEISDAINFIIFDKGKNSDAIFRKVTNYYSINYADIRNNPFGRQIFYIKPYIISPKKGLITASVYFNQFIVEHAVYWAIRNYYMNSSKDNQQTFTDEFGHLFEHYLEEVFIYFGVNYSKIPESDKYKRADWLVSVGEHNILIEQKSAVLPLNIKQQLTDFKSYKSETNKILYKALQQLERTEIDLKVKAPIKIILCYDNYIDSNILPHMFEENQTILNDGRYFIANVMEIEMFIELAKTNYTLFGNVIRCMLKKNKKMDGDGVNLYRIMRDNGYTSDSYWTSSIFDEYKKLLNDIKNRHSFYKDK